MRHREEFFRKVTLQTELKSKKEDIFHLSNMHFQTEYFRSEAEKWKIYMKVANRNNEVDEQIEPMEIMIEDNNSLPIARPSPYGPIGPPAPLDFSDFGDIFDEWLPAPTPTPGQKRK